MQGMKTGLEKMVEWLESQDYRGNNPLGSAIREARRLLDEEKAQDTMIVTKAAWEEISKSTTLSKTEELVRDIQMFIDTSKSDCACRGWLSQILSKFKEAK